jgi:hypothetical protein
MPQTLKDKFASKPKPNIKLKLDEFKRAHGGEEPASDSEIDSVYGPGAATAAMDEVYERMGRKKK